MLFNNPFFLLFLIIVYVLYWRFSRISQNRLLLFASYFFYGCWDVRYLALLAGCSLSSYFVGVGLEKAQEKGIRRWLLFLGLCINFGILGVFKYYNFFVSSLLDLLDVVGVSFPLQIIQVALPVGISFFTFQASSYLIDVYRRDRVVTHNVVDFCTYIAFFPQLVAGPIERASHMLKQFAEVRRFDYIEASNGIRQIVWGLFKKVVIADGLSFYVESLYDQVAQTPGWQLLLGTYFFAIQIYCDFSGYSDIAVGCGRILGFELTQNFRLPYFATNPHAFWSRWHVTLTSWFRDYLYIPLGGNRCSVSRHHLNLLIVFLVSGLWHGANWTFVIWGGLNGVILLLSDVWRKHLPPVEGANSLGRIVLQVAGCLVTFHVILVTWVFFRVESVQDGWIVLRHILTSPFSHWSNYVPYVKPLSLIAVLLGLEWFRRDMVHPLFARNRQYIAWVGSVFVLIAIILFGKFAHVPFIYFQF